jgi:hypothetical protein
MTSTMISLIAFAFIFGGALIGIGVRSVLPERYFTSEEDSVLKLGLGLIATLSAMVLGLLVSTAKSSYDAKRSQLTQIATDAILVDRSLELYGPETSDARIVLHNQLAAFVDQLESVEAGASKPQNSSEGDLSKVDQPTSVDTGASKPRHSPEGLSKVYRMIQKLSPRDDTQRSLKAEALQKSREVGQIRASALAGESSSIPIPFLVVLVFWLTALFVGFGLFARRNFVAIGVLCVCAFTVATAVLLILDMDEPLNGIIKLSVEPLRNAVVEMSDQR